MKVEVKKLPRGQAELIIELSVEEYQPFLAQAASEISLTTKIPGFRPGKASFEIIKQRVGEQGIWEQALEAAIKKTFLQAVDQEKLITVGSPQIDIIKLAPGNPVVYKAVISLLPEVQLTNYLKIRVQSKPVEIKPKQINKAMTDIQKMHAKEILVNREAKEGDKIEIDFETFLDRVPIENGKQTKFSLVIGEATFIPGLEEQLIGLKKADVKEFQLKFPENYHQKALAGKLVDFKIKVNAVFELELPKLDDDFAKNLGGFKTIKEIEDKIMAQITLQKEAEEKQRVEEEMLDKIIEQTTFGDIPDLLVDTETKKMVAELENNLNYQGLNFQDYLSHLKKNKEDLLLDFVPQAIKRVKSALVVREMAKKENIQVSDEEVKDEIKKTIQAYEGNQEAEKQLNQPDYQNYLKSVLAARKVIDHLKSAIITN